MSRAYRIRWLTANRTITSEDELDIEVSMLQILSQQDMIALLDEALAEDGWARSKDGALTKSFGDSVATISADRTKITVTQTRSEQLSARATTKQNLDQSLTQQETAAKRDMERAIAQELVEVDAQIRESVQGALQKVYVRALKKKAASMGQIESLQENVREDGELELTIKVKV